MCPTRGAAAQTNRGMCRSTSVSSPLKSAFRDSDKNNSYAKSRNRVGPGKCASKRSRSVPQILRTAARCSEFHSRLKHATKKGSVCGTSEASPRFAGGSCAPSHQPTSTGTTPFVHGPRPPLHRVIHTRTKGKKNHAHPLSPLRPARAVSRMTSERPAPPSHPPNPPSEPHSRIKRQGRRPSQGRKREVCSGDASRGRTCRVAICARGSTG